MYYYIKGKLAKKEDNIIVIENNGIGYQIYTSLNSMNNSGNIGDIVTIYTYLHIREDVFDLYGFLTIEEKSMFLNLISVTGVGPKAALAILSVATPAKFALAVITNDIKTITKAQGVGPKLAQRVILELKDKLKSENMKSDIDNNQVSDTNMGNKNEAISALMVLGYSENNAQKAVEEVNSELPVEDIIKQALIRLMK